MVIYELECQSADMSVGGVVPNLAGPPEADADYGQCDLAVA
ncbi:MAG: hypothetical protein Q8P59_02745 [Dehalococcoidia bacterium]|nr:hypothetical protein [Dehalococcoidia bacterium]